MFFTLQPTPSQSGRARKTSSSSSTRRKSDGNLTCGLCGHSFRSTPALNGHMRVHSTPDKKVILRFAIATLSTVNKIELSIEIATLAYHGLSSSLTKNC